MPIAMEWERVPLYLDRSFVLPAVRASLAATLVTMLLWPLAAVVRKRRKFLFSKAIRDRREHLWVRVVLALDLLAVARTAGGASLDLTKWNAMLDPWLVLLYAVAWFGVLGSPVVVWITWRIVGTTLSESRAGELGRRQVAYGLDHVRSRAGVRPCS